MMSPPRSSRQTGRPDDLHAAFCPRVHLATSPVDTFTKLRKRVQQQRGLGDHDTLGKKPFRIAHLGQDKQPSGTPSPKGVSERLMYCNRGTQVGGGGMASKPHVWHNLSRVTRQQMAHDKDIPCIFRVVERSTTHQLQYKSRWGPKCTDVMVTVPCCLPSL